MALIVEHHEELEVDLLGQGVDLLDFWRGTLTPRRVEVLIRSLPEKSRTFAKLNPRLAVQEQWTPEAYLLRLIANILGVANFKKFEQLKTPVELFDAAEAESDAESRQVERAAFLLAQLKRAQARDWAEANPSRRRRKTRNN